MNYRTPDLVIRCLKSFIGDIEPSSMKIVIVDNCSGDDSLSILNNWVENNEYSELIRILGAHSNNGFSAGNNIGIGVYEAKYYLLTNSDTLIDQGAIAKLLLTMQSDDHIGLVGPLLRGEDGESQKSCFRFHNAFNEFSIAAETGIFDKMLSRFLVPLPIPAGKLAPDWITFACVMINGEMVNEIGLLDEGYFMYYEDAEYCSRAKQNGWIVICDPAATAVHFRGGSSNIRESRDNNERLPLYYYRSRSRFFYQIYGHLGLFLANVCWLLGRMISKTRQLLGRNDKRVPNRAWLDIWANFINPIDKK